MVMVQQLKWKWRMRENQHFLRLFSSSNSSNSNNNTSPFPSLKDLTANLEDRKSQSSHFSDVKASLRHQPPPPPPRRERFPATFQPLRQEPSQAASLQEIRKNLSEFRRRSAAPLRSPEEEEENQNKNQPSSSSSSSLSFQELYIRSEKGIENKSNAKLSFEAVRESLRQLRSGNENTGNNYKFRDSNSQQVLPPLSLNTLKQSFKIQPSDPNTTPPSPFFMRPSPLSLSVTEKSGSSDSSASKTEFVKIYSHGELGEKLRKLRPTTAKKDKNWFSFTELNARLSKLRELEEKETESKIGGVSFQELRETLMNLRMTTDATTKKSSMQRLALLGQLGGQVTPSYMLSPPKQQLVEKYFHPDNMSSAEKIKLDLKRVRDEFKTSESDCGSSRVQVAQLTTKIKHLSSVLHKKDKHSQKGLQAMVQRRKKLLKYIRRTDWDSYCFLLSKLGLRDNPDYSGQSAGHKVKAGGMGIKKRKRKN